MGSMDWSQIFTMLAGNFIMYLWVVRQSRTDFLHTCRIIESIKSDMKEFNKRLRSIENERK